MTDAPHSVPADQPADDPADGDSLIGEIEQIVSEQIEELEDLIREHPLASFGIAAGAGLIVALLLARR